MGTPDQRRHEAATRGAHEPVLCALVREQCQVHVLGFEQVVHAVQQLDLIERRGDAIPGAGLQGPLGLARPRCDSQYGGRRCSAQVDQGIKNLQVGQVQKDEVEWRVPPAMLAGG